MTIDACIDFLGCVATQWGGRGRGANHESPPPPLHTVNRSHHRRRRRRQLPAHASSPALASSSGGGAGQGRRVAAATAAAAPSSQSSLNPQSVSLSLPSCPVGCLAASAFSEKHQRLREGRESVRATRRLLEGCWTMGEAGRKEGGSQMVIFPLPSVLRRSRRGRRRCFCRRDIDRRN